ncbi:MAG: MFS transporter [Actinomycetota bacterium]
MTELRRLVSGRPGAARVAIAVVVTASSVLPAFLTGAVGVQLRDDLGFGEGALGLAIGAFFLAAAIGSAPGGRLVQRLGAKRSILVALSATIVADLWIAAGARSWSSLAVGLAVGGLGNALTQPAANLLLADSVPAHRLGLAVSLKQAGMPTATLLGGLAVPALALTVGWRWAYVAAAGLAVVAVAAMLRLSDEGRRPAPGTDAPPRRPDSAVSTLVVAASGMVFGAATAGAIGAWVVSSAEASGVASGSAGLLLTLGSAIGICSRVIVGWRADRTRRAPLRTVSTMLAIGAIGVAALSSGDLAVLLPAVAIAFGAGWAWPGLFNFAIVRANPSGPAAATGITQVGTYLGAVVGPVVFGLVVDAADYRTAWLMTAGWAVVAAVVMRVTDRRLGQPSA